MALEIPHPVVDDGKQTLNLERLKAWSEELLAYLNDHSASHLPDGDDPIPTAAASTITGTNAVGTSNSLARADHNHAINLEGTQKDCGADLTVGTTSSDVDNLTYTVGATGTYLVTFDLVAVCTSTGGVLIASLNVNGSDVRSIVLGGASAAANQNLTPISLSRRVSMTAGQVVKVRAIRIAGGYTIEADGSSMIVQRVA